MKKILTLGVVVATLLSMTVTAQNQVRQQTNRPERNTLYQGKHQNITPEKRAEYMAKQLDLSDAEKAKVQALYEKQALKTKQHQEEMKKMRDVQLSRMEAERSANEAELITIIGKDKFQKLQSQRIARLEKENRMLKMRMMRKDAPSEHQRTRMENRKNVPKKK